MALRASGRPRLSMSIDPARAWLGHSTRSRSDRAVEAFWVWWTRAGRTECAEAVRVADVSSVIPELTSLVEAIEPGLAWEFGPGKDGSAHRLTVTAAGVPELRGAARRWLAGAPDACETWSFADLRDPVSGSAMFFRGHRLAFADTEIAVDPGLSVLDVCVHHPVFVHLGAEDRSLAAYLLLDATVGEAAVETWIGRITASHEPAGSDGRALSELAALLSRLADDNVDEDGRPAWQILQADTEKGPMVAMVRTPLVALSAPQFDRHVRVDVTYRDQIDFGLPGPDSLAALRDFEDFLSERIGERGECVAAESCDGRRRLHFYVDSRTPAAEQLRAAAGGWDQGFVDVEVTDDPGWADVQHLRV